MQVCVNVVMINEKSEKKEKKKIKIKKAVKSPTDMQNAFLL